MNPAIMASLNNTASSAPDIPITLIIMMVCAVGFVVLMTVGFHLIDRSQRYYGGWIKSELLCGIVLCIVGIAMLVVSVALQ